MSRHIDENKIKAIKKATIEVVVREGVSGASVQKIAQKSKVSVGYLYRFYKGKRELLEALFEERCQVILALLREQVSSQKTVKGIVTLFISTIYNVVQREPQAIGFTHKLLSDFSFELPKEFKADVNQICTEVIKIGQKTGEINPKITNEILYTVVLGGVFNFINIRLRHIFEEKPFDTEDITTTTNLLLKTLA